MKQTMNRLFAAAALLACFACSKIETGINNVMNDEVGDFVYIAPIVEDDVPMTRGYKTSDWVYHFEVGERIAIWDDLNDVMRFKVAEVFPNGRAKIDGGKFHLDDGETYWATYPYVSANADLDRDAQVYTYEGQTQTDQNLTDGKLTELAKFSYNWASATRENGSSSFNFTRLSTFFRVVATLPEADMTIKEIAVTADKNVFDLNGTFDLTTGELIPDGDYTNTIKMTLNNLTVSGNVITAYFASNPLEAANYVISITDSNDKVYKSIEVAKGARAAGAATAFVVDVAPVGGYVKVTSMPNVLDGKYLLIYPTNGKYRAFSFTKTMENAETAAASVATTAFADLYDQSSTLYNTVIGGNYVEITDEDGDGILMLTDEQEAELALNMAANSSPWTVTENAKDLQTTLTSGSYSLGVDHLVANVASDGKADLVASFNAPNAVAIMNTLRGHDVNVTFDDLIKLALEKVDGFDATPNSIDDQFVRKAFTKLVAVAQEIVAENPHNLFPAGSSLMTIDFNTNAFDVFKQYHDNVADLSWRMSPEKRFGLAQLGYNDNANGFTAQVDLPSYEWFNKLNESLVQSLVEMKTFTNPLYPMMGPESVTIPILSRTKFVDYWKTVDTQYTVKIDGNKIDGFFEKIANKLLAQLDEVPTPTSAIGATQLANDEFYQLYYAAVEGKFTAVGNSYKTLAEKLNTGIQPAFIYKKVADAE